MVTSPILLILRSFSPLFFLLRDQFAGISFQGSKRKLRVAGGASQTLGAFAVVIGFEPTAPYGLDRKFFPAKDMQSLFAT